MEVPLENYILPDEKLEEMSYRLQDLLKEINKIESSAGERETKGGDHTPEDRLYIERDKIEEAFFYHQMAIEEREKKLGANSDETKKVINNSFQDINTISPTEANKKLSQEPKVESLLNATVKDLASKGKEGVEKTTGVKPSIAVKTALIDNGTNLDNVNDNNVGPAVGTITTDPDFQAQMRKVESSLSKKIGTYFISNLPFIIVLGVVIAILVLIDEGKVSPAAAVTAASQSLSGCYMIYGDGKVYNYIKLTGCSDWYSQNTYNLSKCRCNSTDDVSKPMDCTVNDTDLPYCIGKIDTSGGKKICVNPKDKNIPPSALLKCQGEIGQNGTFIRYTSNYEDIFSIVTKLISLTQITKGNIYNPPKNLIENFGLIEKIAIAIGIIVILLILGLTIYNVFGKKKIKNKK